MLGNSIALIAVAVLLGVEAWKASGGIARVVLTLLAVAFALSGVLLKWLTDTVPRLGQIVADTFSQPAAWFVLLVALFFVVRPLWAKAPDKEPPAQTEQLLGLRANDIATRLNLHRGIYQRVQQVRDPMHNIINDGISLMLTFNKHGMACPVLSELSADEVAWTMLDYFVRMGPLLRDGHLDEAKQSALQIAEQARISAKRNGAFHND